MTGTSGEFSNNRSRLRPESWAVPASVAGEGLDCCDVVSSPMRAGVNGWTAGEESLKLPPPIAGDFLDGTVLLLPRPPVGVVATAGLVGVLEPSLECRELTERFLRSLPSLRTLSAPALAVEADLSRPDWFTPTAGVSGPWGVPDSTSCTVFSSAAVPCIPIKK